MTGPQGPVAGVGDAAVFPSDDPLHALDSPTAGARVIRGGMLRVGTYAVGVALGVLSAAVMTRHLGVEDFGRYVIVTSLIAIVAGLGEAGVPNIAAREFATRERDERDRLMANVLGIRLAVAVLGVAVATLFGLGAGYDSTMVAGTVLAGIGLVLATVQQTYSIPIGVSLRFGWLGTLDLLRQATFVGLVVVLVQVGAGLLPFLAVTIPASLVILVASIPLVRGLGPLLPRFEGAEWLGILRLVGIYAAAAAAGTIYVSAVIVTTSLVGTAEDSGYLGAAFRVFVILGGIPMLLLSTAFPVLARAAHTDRERLQYAFQRLIDISLIVGTWMAIGTVFGADAAIAIVAGPDFEPAVPVLQIEGVALLSSFLAITGGFVLISMRRHIALLVGNAVGLLTAIVLTTILVRAYGPEGAATATLVAETVIVVAYAFVLARSRLVHYDLHVPPRVIVAAGLAAALALAPLGSLALVAVSTVVYWGVLFALRGVPHEVIDAVLRRPPRTDS